MDLLALNVVLDSLLVRTANHVNAKLLIAPSANNKMELNARFAILDM